MFDHYKLYLGTTVSCLICGGAWLLLNQPAELTPTSNQQETSLPKNSTPPLVKNWQEHTRVSLSQGTARDFSKKISQLGHKELSKIASEIHAALKNNPETTAAWLEQVSLELVEENNHQQASKLLDLLPFAKQVPDIERKVFHDWVEKTPEKLFDFLSDSSSDKSINDHQLSILSSVLQNESSDQFANYLSWIEQTKNPVLKGTAIQKIVTHLDSKNVTKVGEVISSDLDNGPIAAALFDYVGKHSPDDRAETLDWISSLPTTNLGLKGRAFGKLIQHIATEDVDNAIDILNADNFLTKYYDNSEEATLASNGDWSPSAQLFFDITLESFIKGAMFTDMELARDSADSFFNPQLKAAYTEFLNENLHTPQSHAYHCESCDNKEKHTH